MAIFTVNNLIIFLVGALFGYLLPRIYHKVTGKTL